MAVGQVIYSPERTPPAWAGDGLTPKSILPGGIKLEAAQFTSAELTVAANAAVDATTITLSAPLTRDLNPGVIVDFGGKKFARLTAPAPVGATSLTVAAIPTALVAGDVGNFSGRKPIPSGTLVGRTYAERDSNVGFGPAVVASDEEMYLLAFDVPDAIENPYGAAYRHECIVYEKYLPGWATMAAPVRTAIRNLYQCMEGV
jgi:hypothetical protein